MVGRKAGSVRKRDQNGIAYLVGALLLCVACATDPDAPCGDSTFWSQRSAEWPVDTLWIGGEAVAMYEAMDLLELPPRDARDRLSTALVVAELNLAAGASEDVLPLVYAGHSWLSYDDGDPTVAHEADALADALESHVCR